MFGIVRPCAHRLAEGLKAAWTAHLCGLCLALRADHGQFARVVTNYDGLIVSVLTEAQTGPVPGARRTAGPCPLRALRTASVARGEGARLAAAVSLVLASAKVRDHVADGDGALARRPVAAAARRVAAGWDRAGARTGAELGFDTAVLLEAVDRQPGIEALAGPGTPLLTITEPTETATAAAFAHTALLAGRPENAAPLAEAGRLFGRLAHLLDAVEDQAADAASGAWNPLTATGAPLFEARRLADDAVRGVRLALRDAHFADDRLVHVLLGRELRAAVDRAFGAHRCGASAGELLHEDGARAAYGGGGGAEYAPGPNGPIRQRPSGGPHGGRGPSGPGGGGHGGGSARGSGQGPERPPRRGLLAGCAAFSWLCCTCQLCCAKEYEGPWSRKKRQGCCHSCDCSSSGVDGPARDTGGGDGGCCDCSCGG